MRRQHKIIVAIIVVLLLILTANSALAAPADVEITSVKVGLKNNLKVYADKAETDQFYAGEKVFFEVTLKNNLKAESGKVGSVDKLSLTAKTTGKLDMPSEVTLTDSKKTFINPGTEEKMSFSILVPYGFDTAKETIELTVQGEYHDMPEKVTPAAKSSVVANLNRKAHDFKFVGKEDLEKTKLTLTCDVKKKGQTLLISVANTGAGVADNTLLKMSVDGNVLGDGQALKGVKKGETQKFDAALNFVELIGTKKVVLSVNDESNNPAIASYDTATIEATVENCLVEIKNFVVEPFMEDTTTTIDLTDKVNNVEKSQTVTLKAQGSQHITASLKDKTLTLTPAKDWNGEEKVVLVGNDGIADTKLELTIKVLQDNKDEPTMTKKEPTGQKVDVSKEGEVNLEVSVNNPDKMIVDYVWSVDNLDQKVTGEKFTLKGKDFAVQQHVVKVVIGKDQPWKKELTWDVMIIDKPTDFANFPGAKTTKPENIVDTKKVAGFTLDTSVGMIEFAEDVDISALTSFSSVVSIKEGSVALDSTKAAGLNKKAKITLKKKFADPVILKSSGFNSGNFVVCTDCKVVDDGKVSGQFTFEVNGFSTYKVDEKKAVGFTLSNVLFSNASRKATVETTFTLKNTGSVEQVNSIAFDLSGIPTKYQAKVIDAPTSLDADATKTVKLQVFIPDTEAGGKHNIGLLKVSGKDPAGTMISQTAFVQINPLSSLSVDSFKVNGKSSGKLLLDKENEIEVRVQNDDAKDMENVVVKVKLLDVDGDDLEEEADSVDIDTGDSEKVTVKFDLTQEIVDKDEYTLEFTIEGETTDGVEHNSVMTEKVSVDREKFKVFLKKASLGVNLLECSRDTTLYVEIENAGTSDAEDVQIKVKNGLLGINEVRSGITLDKYSDSDNDYQTSFDLNVKNAVAADYTLKVEVYHKTSLVDSEDLTLSVKDCALLKGTTTNTAATTAAANDLAKELQAQLQQQQKASTPGSGVGPTAATVANTSFRESDTYTLLLGVLIVLVFLALVLSLAVLVLRKK